MAFSSFPGRGRPQSSLERDEAMARALVERERQEAILAQDAALARSLAEGEDAALARRYAAAEGAGRQAGAASSAPAGRQAAGQVQRCPRGHNLQACLPQQTSRHTCDGCQRSILYPVPFSRCHSCNFDLCEECASGRGPQPRPPASRPSAPAAPHHVSGHSSGEDRGMVYVACVIGDGGAVEMMVDTGAQMSVISAPLAQRFGLMAHLDRSHQGVASGVGQARILGKLRGVPVKLGLVEFALDFSVLGIDDPLLMLGLDQMRRFKCIVDLEQDCLRFGGRGGVEVPFLPNPPRMADYAMRCPMM